MTEPDLEERLRYALRGSSNRCVRSDRASAASRCSRYGVKGHHKWTFPDIRWPRRWSGGQRSRNSRFA